MGSTGRGRGGIALLVVAGLLAACEGGKGGKASPPTRAKSDDRPEAAAGGPGPEHRGGDLAGPGRPLEGSGDACAAACAHRAECVPGADPVERCAGACATLAGIPGAVDLAGYAATSCDEARRQEPSVRLTLECASACRRRADCVPAASDVRACVGDCAGMAMFVGVERFQSQLEMARDDSCEEFEAAEPEWQKASTCLRGCVHVLECGVAGTIEGCLGECLKGLGGGAISLEAASALAGRDCDDLRQSFSLASARPAASAATAAAPGSGEAVDVGACLDRGEQTCPSGMMCCKLSAGRSTRPGEPGMCAYPPVCMMPRR